jgi:hypothetical protein
MHISHRLRRTIGVLASTTLAMGAIAIASPAARADGTLSGPATANISQNVTYTLTSASEGQLQLEDQTGQVLSTVTAGFGSPTVKFTFTTPSSAATLSLSVWNVDTQGFVSNSVPLTVGGAVSTTTVISAPNTAVIGQSTTINVNVTSNSGSQYTPAGQVRLTDANGAQYVLMNLTAGPAAGQSFAYYRWTPKTAGTFFFIATYVPAAGSQASASASVQDAIIATPSGNTISLTAPANLSVGTPVTLVATVYPSNVQGSVGFNVNGAWISPSIPLVNGQATYSWKPTTAGQVTLGASYTTNNGGSGSTTDVVTVGAPTATDAITLVQPGWGNWSNGGSYNMGNGSNFTFQASTLSGAAVTLSETGPCQISGLTLSVNSGSGNCTMKAVSPGGNGYSGVTYTYNINLVPGIQTANLSAPNSGSYKVGRVLVLESPNATDTNAGQNINWVIKKGGKKHCALLYPSTGAVTLRVKNKGTCTVIGKAPGVSGQWQPFQTARNYTGR